MLRQQTCEIGESANQLTVNDSSRRRKTYEFGLGRVEFWEVKGRQLIGSLHL